MAKALEIEGLSEDLPYGDAAARVLEVRTGELMAHSEGVLDVERIEGVHDMRVTTRRLRAAIEVFWPCLPKGERKRALADVKALADVLGERRDRDVAIGVLRELADSMPGPDRPGVSSLISELRAEQLKANRDLTAAVQPAKLEELRDRLLALAEAARIEGAE